MTWTELEKEFTAEMSRISGLVVDVDIFAGPLPEKKNNAVGVFINQSGNESKLEMQRYSVQMLGRYEKRSDAAATLAKFGGQFPGLIGKFYSLPSGYPMLYRSAWNGHDCWSISINLEIRLTQ